MRRRSTRIIAVIGFVMLMATLSLRKLERGFRSGARSAPAASAEGPANQAAERTQTPMSSRAAGAAGAPSAAAANPTPLPAEQVTPAQALAIVRMLVNRGQVGAARALATRYLRVIPEGPEADQIKSLTGVHPHP